MSTPPACEQGAVELGANVRQSPKIVSKVAIDHTHTVFRRALTHRRVAHIIGSVTAPVQRLAAVVDPKPSDRAVKHCGGNALGEHTDRERWLHFVVHSLVVQHKRVLFDAGRLFALNCHLHQPLAEQRQRSVGSRLSRPLPNKLCPMPAGAVRRRDWGDGEGEDMEQDRSCHTPPSWHHRGGHCR